MKLRLFSVVLISTFLSLIFASLAHVCSDVATPGNSQWGCPDPVYPTSTEPSVNGNIINFIINVKNRRIEYYGYGCNDLGLPYCYECKNWQGVCGCNTGGWQGDFYNVMVQLASCSPSCDLTDCPDCDFGVSINPSSGQRISNENSKDFNVEITVYKANGNYNLTFNVPVEGIKTRQYLVQISVQGQQGTGGDNSACGLCSSQSCDSSQQVCTSTCTGATYCPGDSSCYFETQASGSSPSCCGDDSGEIYTACAKSERIGWTCPTQNACCSLQGSCAYSGSCYSGNNVYHLKTGDDAYSYCSSGIWHSCDEDSSICSLCGFSWSQNSCCGDDSGEYYAELCPGVSGVERMCCNSPQERVNGEGKCTTVCEQQDAIPPATITNLDVFNVKQTSVDLKWIAPGDDGNSGTASYYDIRYSKSNITQSNWGSASQVSNEPSPLPAGTEQSITVTGLSPYTGYYFAIMAFDDSGNPSEISNVPYVVTRHRSDTSQNGYIDLSELVAFINRWKLDINDVTIKEIIEAIGLWKKGYY
ncbi:MAG: fibronectin type III domain-containing protein [Candidatus Aenigmatarchaeota archaeon]